MIPFGFSGYSGSSAAHSICFCRYRWFAVRRGGARARLVPKCSALIMLFLEFSLCVSVDYTWGFPSLKIDSGSFSAVDATDGYATNTDVSVQIHKILTAAGTTGFLADIHPVKAVPGNSAKRSVVNHHFSSRSFWHFWLSNKMVPMIVDKAGTMIPLRNSYTLFTSVSLQRNVVLWGLVSTRLL